VEQRSYAPAGEDRQAVASKISSRPPPSRGDGAFLTQFQKGFHPVSLNNILKKYLALAGLPWKMNCHLLRHACATHMLQGGATSDMFRSCWATRGWGPPKFTPTYTRRT